MVWGSFKGFQCSFRVLGVPLTALGIPFRVPLRVFWVPVWVFGVLFRRLEFRVHRAASGFLIRCL